MTAIIILAAGESRRLGKPKQNLIFQGKTLLQRVIETALSTSCTPVVVVLGANANAITPTIQAYPITVVVNNSWAEGMASSLIAGINLLEQTENVDNALVMLCDQPFVGAQLITDLLKKKQETGLPIAACKYKETIGVPVIFNRSLFPELLLLKGHEGAKQVVANHAGEVATVPFDLGVVDIDTVEDYNKLVGGL